MKPSTARWFAVAGLAALAVFVLDLGGAPGGDPYSVADVVAVATRTLAGVALGVALILSWRDPPLAAGAFWLLLGGVGAIVQALGYVVGEVLDSRMAVAAFVAGGMLMLLSLGAAGLGALITHSDLRACGMFYLVGGLTAGQVGLGALAAGTTWLLFAWWLRRQAPAPTDAVDTRS